jgi:hypothetical protein
MQKARLFRYCGLLIVYFKWEINAKHNELKSIGKIKASFKTLENC